MNNYLPQIQTALLGLLVLLLGYHIFFQAAGSATNTKNTAMVNSPQNRTTAQRRNPRINPRTGEILPDNVPKGMVQNPNNPNAFTKPFKKPTGPSTSIKFKNTSHAFGEVKHGSSVTHFFEFTNTGDEPYTITNAQGSCGCTVPEYPKEPIMPGKTGKIKVVFTPKKNQKGMINQTVTLVGNTEPIRTKLSISAEVENTMPTLGPVK